MHEIKQEGNLFLLLHLHLLLTSGLSLHYVIIRHDSKWHPPPVFESHPRSR